jgi:FixJ family two-component response regulator
MTNISPPPSYIVTFWDGLTDREKDVLRVCMADLPMVALAGQLCVSPNTLKTHRSHILQKWAAATGKTAKGQSAFRSMLRQVAPYLPA